MSPVGDSFRNRIRQYPALVNCTTIDWFWEWPREALLEVAERCLQGAAPSGTTGTTAADGTSGGTGTTTADGTADGTSDSPELQAKVAQMFVTMHRSVADSSRRMLVELQRHNYVTPTNYLELVGGYKRLLAEKRRELGHQVTKLRSGLHKIDDTSRKVEAMRAQLEEAKRRVADFQRQCEEYLVVIVQQKREADEQQKAVVSHSERISLEEAKCKSLAQNAQRDLDTRRCQPWRRP
ncbi:dynein axonemal heavy chain 2-like [Lampetra fluviatilis]